MCLNPPSLPTRRSSDLPAIVTVPAGATVSNLIASAFETALTFPARSTTQAVYVHTPCRPSDPNPPALSARSEEHTTELQSPYVLVYRLPLEKHTFGDNS